MKDINKQRNKNGIVLVIILAVIFGLASGVVGELIARSYLLNYNVPFFGELDISSGDYHKANLIIRDARKVVVEQDAKINEAINSAKSSIVGIFEKKELNNNTSNYNLKNYYQVDKELGQGLIITSDGWILTNLKLGFPENYVVITNDKKIYAIDKIVSDSLTPYNFIQITAKDLPVKRFASKDEINNGQLTIALNWDGQSSHSRIANGRDSQSLIKKSDNLNCQLLLVNLPGDEFKGSFLYNLSGDVLGLIQDNKKIIPIYHLEGAIISLLKYGEVRRASLGVNYVNLADLVNIQKNEAVPNSNDKGALIYKNKQGIAVTEKSPADNAGLQQGDIITHIDNIEINKQNDLADIIQRYVARDKIRIIFLRNNKELEVELILGEIE